MKAIPVEENASMKRHRFCNVDRLRGGEKKLRNFEMPPTGATEDILNKLS